VIALDTSVAVATFGAWHELHEVARAALTTDSRLTAHTALEAGAPDELSALGIAGGARGALTTGSRLTALCTTA